MGRIAAVMLALTVLLAAGVAQATQAGQQAIKNWAEMDKCAHDAQSAYPDYSAEAYAKREAQLKACLEQLNLPPRAPLDPTH